MLPTFTNIMAKPTIDQNSLNNLDDSSIVMIPIPNTRRTDLSSVNQSADPSIDTRILFFNAARKEIMKLPREDYTTTTELENDRLATASEKPDSTIQIYSLKNGELVQTLSQHGDGVSVMKGLENDHLAVAGLRNPTIKIYNLNTGRLVKTLPIKNKLIKNDDDLKKELLEIQKIIINARLIKRFSQERREGAEGREREKWALFKTIPIELKAEIVSMTSSNSSKEYDSIAYSIINQSIQKTSIS